MNSLFLQFGLQAWKPLLTVLLLPPTPMLMLMLLGVALARRRAAMGLPLVLGCAVLIWLSACSGAADLLATALLHQPPPLAPRQIAELRSHAREPVAIIVLGGGVENWAPEYGNSSLQFRSLERLRYGIWLGRETGWPVGFSGGVGWGQPADASAAEATVAQRIAAQEFGRPLKWVENRSRDTRENGLNTVALSKPQGVRRVLLVTHAWHMRRAVRDFQAAAGGALTIEAAPIGLAGGTELAPMRWLPSGDGLMQTRVVLREWLGWVAGA